MRWRYLLLSLVLAAVALRLPARPGPTEDAAAFLEKYIGALNDRDAAALAALYTEDGLLLPPGGGPVRGREAIRRYWAGNRRTGLTLKMLKQELGAETGFFVGRYAVRTPLQGPVRGSGGIFVLAGAPGDRPGDGSLVLCLKRGEGGAWQIAADTWSENVQIGFVPAVLRNP